MSMSEGPAEPAVTKSWSKFYEANRDSPPRPLLLKTLELMGDGFAPGQAIELGCGQGADAAEMLSRGWRVLAIDGSEEGIELTRGRAEALGLSESLEARCARFEDLDVLPPARLVYAGMSLPFCPPENFDSLWRKIIAAVQAGPGGWISAQFLGPNDTWAGNPALSIHSQPDVERLFSEMDVRFFHERDEDGQAVSGPKHWHIFSVIAETSGAS